MNATETTSATKEPSPWTSPTALLSMAFCALVVALAAVIAVNGGGGARAARPAGTPGSAGSASSDPQLPSAAGVTQAPDPAVPTLPPADVRWVLYKTVALPWSTSAGPRSAEGEAVFGFAHTPTGALLAATHISTRYLLANQGWRDIVDKSLAPGPGRDAWVRIRTPVAQLAEPRPGQLGQFAGFRFVDYTPDRAVVQLVTRFSSGRLQALTLTTAWDGGDWRLVLQPGGNPAPNAQTVPDLDGFVPWGGV